MRLLQVGRIEPNPYVALSTPLLWAVYGKEYFIRTESQGWTDGPVDFVISWLLPAFASIAFWVSARRRQGLGIFWVAFDARKLGWHDKLAHTVVVRSR